MKDQTIRRVLAFFLLISAVLIAVAVTAVRNINRSANTSDWVNHTHAVILEAEALRSALHEGDGAMRTSVMTGDARDRAVCREALASVSEHLEVTKALTRNEPAQSLQIRELESLVNRRIDFIRQVLVARESGGPEATRVLLATDAGGEAMREVQRVIEKLKSDEMALLAERDTAAYAQAQTTRWTVWLGVTLDVVLLGVLGWLIRDDIAARRRVTETLHEVNAQLETRVRERTADLAAVNARLSTENLERQWTNQALEHQLRYNQLIVNSITDLVFVLTKAMNVSRVNPAVVHLTGFEPADLIGQPLSRVLRLVTEAGGTEAPMLDPIAQALKDGHDLQDLPALLADKRGRQIAVCFTLFPLRDGNKVVGGVATLKLVSPDR